MAADSRKKTVYAFESLDGKRVLYSKYQEPGIWSVHRAQSGHRRCDVECVGDDRPTMRLLRSTTSERITTYLDTELKVPENGFERGYKAGPVDLRFVMRLNDKGECGDRRREIRRQSTPADIRDDLAQAELGRKE